MRAKAVLWFVFGWSMSLSFLTATGQQKMSIRKIIKDTTPVEFLEYKLSKQEFLSNYGIDDTARALIRMFFRKRNQTALSCCVSPAAGGAATLYFFSQTKGKGEQAAGGPLLLGLLSGVAGLVLIPADGIITRLIYTRKKLLYTLVNRERGIPVPVRILVQIKKRDFES